MRRLALGFHKGKRMLRPLVRLRGGEWGRNTTAGVCGGSPLGLALGGRWWAINDHRFTRMLRPCFVYV